MIYPNMAAVEQADRVQLARWHRFLPSPGMAAIGTDRFEASLEAEALIMNRIQARFAEQGGFSPAISKAIGWGDEFR